MTQYSAGDIQKYLNGELSGPEMNALEKAALEDPFLADAIEGIGSARSLRGDASFQNDMADLDRRLKDRTSKKNKQAPLIFVRSGWRVSAAVILFAGLATVSYQYLFNEKVSLAKKEENKSPRKDIPSTPAMTDSSAAAPATASGSANADTLHNGQEVAIAPATPTATQASKGSTAQTKTTKKASTVNTEAAAESRSPVYKDGSRNAPALQTTTIPAPNAALAAKGKVAEEYDARFFKAADAAKADTFKELKALAFKGYYSSDHRELDSLNLSDKAKKAMIRGKNYPPSNYFFSGKVLDQNNRPLSGVNLSLANRPGFSTLSDNNGLFRLNVRRQDTTAMLLANYTGYEPVTMTLSSDNATGNIIRLQPHPGSLNEVVMNSFGAQRKKDLAGRKDSTTEKETAAGKGAGSKVFVQHAVPVKGWPEYESWLKENKGMATSDPALKGDAIISFSVDKKGALSVFRIEQSLSPTLDSALIHLIREGPEWRPLKGRKGRATVTVSF